MAIIQAPISKRAAWLQPSGRFAWPRKAVEAFRDYMAGLDGFGDKELPCGRAASDSGDTWQT